MQLEHDRRLLRLSQFMLHGYPTIPCCVIWPEFPKALLNEPHVNK